MEAAAGRPEPRPQARASRTLAAVLEERVPFPAGLRMSSLSRLKRALRPPGNPWENEKRWLRPPLPNTRILSATCRAPALRGGPAEELVSEAPEFVIARTVCIHQFNYPIDLRV
jgi:hypothetical protein